MEKKQERKRKVRFNYFLKRKIIMGVCLFLVLIGGVVTAFAFINKEDKNLKNKQEEIAKEIPAKSPYTLDVINKRIKGNYIDMCRTEKDLKEDCEQFAYVILHFYDYYNKDTKFLALSTDFSENVKSEYKYYTYEEYQKVFNGDKSYVDVLDSDNDVNQYRSYIPKASLFIKKFGVVV